jgi:hypothetical protein
MPCHDDSLDVVVCAHDAKKHQKKHPNLKKRLLCVSLGSKSYGPKKQLPLWFMSTTCSIPWHMAEVFCAPSEVQNDSPSIHWTGKTSKSYSSCQGSTIWKVNYQHSMHPPIDWSDSLVSLSLLQKAFWPHRPGRWLRRSSPPPSRFKLPDTG